MPNSQVDSYNATPPQSKDISAARDIAQYLRPRRKSAAYPHSAHHRVATGIRVSTCVTRFPRGRVQLCRLLPEERPIDRSCDHSQQPLGPSDNAGTNSDSPGVLVAAEPLLGPGDQGVRVQIGAGPPPGARTTTAQISSPRTSSANPITATWTMPGWPASISSTSRSTSRG